MGNVADFQDVFRHEPYIASFRAGNFDFRFLLLHTRWTTEPERAQEVGRIAELFRFFQGLTAEKDLVLAGDFNYSHGSAKMQPIKGLPNLRNLIPLGTKSTLKSGSEGFSAWYDHIYVDRVATRRRPPAEETPTTSCGVWGTRARSMRSGTSPITCPCGRSSGSMARTMIKSRILSSDPA